MSFEKQLEKIVQRCRDGIDPAGISDTERAVFSQMLANSGCHPKTAQLLLRHSDVNLTLQVYTHTVREALTSAINKLPDLSTPNSEGMRATETDDMLVGDGKDVLSVCLAKSGVKNQKQPDSTGKLKKCVHNVSDDYNPESKILGKVPVAQLDSALASGVPTGLISACLYFCYMRFSASKHTLSQAAYSSELTLG